MLINELEHMVKTGQFEELSKRLDTVMYSDYMETCHLNIAMKGMDHVEARNAIEKADKIGLELDSVTFNTLISRAKRFGTEKLCEDIVEEMKIRGISHDNHTERALSLSMAEANRITTAEMLKLRRRGYKKSVLHMIDTLFRNDRADELHVQTALGACETPGELHRLLTHTKRCKIDLNEDTKRFVRFASDRVLSVSCVGIVKRVMKDKGYGFVQCNEDGLYVYFRLSDVNPEGDVNIGDELSFRVRNNLGQKNPRAVSITTV